MLTKKLKLSALSEAMLKDKEMCSILGGTLCTCSCLYEGKPGGASWDKNSAANYHLGGPYGNGGYSPGGCNNYYTSNFGSDILTGHAPHYQDMHE